MTMIERVAAAIEEAQMRHREGPYGFYDYSDYVAPTGLNTPFQIRDFRDPKSDTYGKTLVSSNDYASLRETFEKMTREYVARKAIEAMREPTKEMIEFGSDNLPWDSSWGSPDEDDTMKVYQSMVDCALSEPTDGD